MRVYIVWISITSQNMGQLPVSICSYVWESAGKKQKLVCLIAWFAFKFSHVSDKPLILTKTLLFAQHFAIFVLSQ